MTGFVLGRASELRLSSPGLHPDVIKLVRHAADLSPVTFSVAQGIRTRQEQFELWRSCHYINGGRIPGAEWKTNCNGTPKGEKSPEGADGTGESNHQDGHAVDLAVIVNGRAVWEERYYERLNVIIQQAADELGIPIVWGGTFPTPDKDHWELDRKHYPRKE